MLKKLIKFENFDGQPDSQIAYFNLSKSEITKWELEESVINEEGNDYTGGLKDRIDQIMKSRQGGKIMAMLEDVLRRSYGIKSDDGTSFDKDPAHFEAFKKTAAYDALFMELITGGEYAAEFIGSLLPADMRQDPDKPAPGYRPTPPPSAPVQGGAVPDAAPQIQMTETTSVPNQQLTPEQMQQAYQQNQQRPMMQ